MARKLRLEVEGGLGGAIGVNPAILRFSSVTDISDITGIDTSTVSRRCDAARQRLANDSKLAYPKSEVERECARIAESQD